MKVLIELFQKFTVSKGRAFGGIFKGKALELTRRFDMTKKEDTFCCYYSSNGNAELSAVMAGYAKNAGQRLLMKKGISERIKEYRNIRLENLRLAALTGYERLAFGRYSRILRKPVCRFIRHSKKVQVYSTVTR